MQMQATQGFSAEIGQLSLQLRLASHSHPATHSMISKLPLQTIPHFLLNTTPPQQHRLINCSLQVSAFAVSGSASQYVDICASPADPLLRI